MLTQVLLQVLIIVTGNYNFFNLLTLVLTTALLDDQHLAARSGNSRRKKTPACECPLPGQPAILTRTAGRVSVPFPQQPRSQLTMTVLPCSLAQGSAGPAAPAAGTDRLWAAGLWRRALLWSGGRLGAPHHPLQNQ